MQLPKLTAHTLRICIIGCEVVRWGVTLCWWRGMFLLIMIGRQLSRCLLTSRLSIPGRSKTRLRLPVRWLSMSPFSLALFWLCNGIPSKGHQPIYGKLWLRQYRGIMANFSELQLLCLKIWYENILLSSEHKPHSCVTVSFKPDLSILSRLGLLTNLLVKWPNYVNLFYHVPVFHEPHFHEMLHHGYVHGNVHG